ncbi:MAG TPA: type IV pilus biogenesis/stability protein PilW [Steroidobacteraceae bacterium]|nr:type IV pilus biogenesis/stability protein PilW [Steroidobacteraceae bacterium]
MRQMRIAGSLALLLTLTMLAGCKGSPPPYQPANHSRKPDPEQAAIANMKMAQEYLRTNNLSRAQERIERALTEAPDNAYVQETAGLVYEQLKDAPKAQHAFAAAARLGKQNPDIQNSYAGYLCRNGKVKAGEKLLLEVASNPVYQTPQVALVNAGVCVEGAGDVVDAERYFTRALAIRPNMPEALLQLGNLALQRGDAKQALDDVQRYLAVNPATAEILWIGFLAERKLGDNTGAASYARRVQSEFPDSQPAQSLRAGVSR